MARMRPLLEAPVLVGVGAAFDFLAGRKRQAPRWMQRARPRVAVPPLAGAAAAAAPLPALQPGVRGGVRAPVRARARRQGALLRRPPEW